MISAEQAEYIRKVVANAPPLPNATRTRLTAIFRPLIEASADRAASTAQTTKAAA